METRTELIQKLIDRYDLRSYLEIGVQNKANNFDKIHAQLKIGVDPDPAAKATYPITSNEFFLLAIANEVRYDLIFIDGLHHADQVEKDIENALMCLSVKGWIVVHDCNPSEEIRQIVPRINKVWNGDVWKAWVKLRENPKLDMVVVDMDHGCGVIHRGIQSPLEREEELIYKNLSVNRQSWLNLVRPEWFESIYL